MAKNNSSALASMIRGNTIPNIQRANNMSTFRQGASVIGKNVQNNSESLQKILDSSSEETRVEFRKLTNMLIKNSDKTGKSQLKALEDVAAQMEKIKTSAGKQGEALSELVGFEKAKEKFTGSRVSGVASAVMSPNKVGLGGLRARKDRAAALEKGEKIGAGLDIDGGPVVDVLEDNNELLKKISENTEGIGGSGGFLSTLLPLLTALGMGIPRLNDLLNGRDTSDFTTIGDPLQVNQTTDGGTTVTTEDGSQVQLEENVLDNTANDEILAAKAVNATVKVGTPVVKTAATAVSKAGTAALNIMPTSAGVKILDTAADVADGALAKNIGKLIQNKVARAIPGIVGKSLPFAGALIGLGQGIWRAAKGDLVGAALSAGSGLAGPLSALTLGAADIAREIYKEVYGVPPEDDPEGGMERLAAIGDLTLMEMKKAWDEFGADEQLQENTPEAYVNQAVEEGLIEDGGIFGADKVNEEKLAAETNSEKLEALISNAGLGARQRRQIQGRLDEIAENPGMDTAPVTIPDGVDGVSDSSMSEALIDTSPLPTSAAVENTTDLAAAPTSAPAPVINNITNNNQQDNSSSASNFFSNPGRNDSSSWQRYTDNRMMG